MNNTFLKRCGLARGFSLVEVLVVIAVIAVLALMAVPSLMSIVPNFQARKATETASSLMYMARMTAANTQKPVRAVVNCHPTDQPCRLTLYTAAFLYNSAAVPPNKTVSLSGWNEVPNVARYIANGVRVSANPSDRLSGSPDNVYWAVFLPKGGLIASSHNPMKLIVRYGDKITPAWAISVDKITGQVVVRSVGS